MYDFKYRLLVGSLLASLLIPATAPAADAPGPVATTGIADAAHPNLTGLWGGRGGGAPPVAAEGAPGGGNRAFGPLAGAGGVTANGQETAMATRDGSVNNLEVDAEFLAKTGRNVPYYKPEYWEEVRNLEEFAYRRPADPSYGCKNPGIARLGAPAEIVQLPNKMIFLYSGEHVWVREFPTDGRALPKEDDYEGTGIVGTSVGHWDGDTLVVETVDFASDSVWLGSRGWIMSPEAKITERYRRDGDVLSINTVVEDPKLLRPWVMDPQRVNLNRNPRALLTQPLPCGERDGQFLPGS